MYIVNIYGVYGIYDDIDLPISIVLKEGIKTHIDKYINTNIYNI